MSTAKLKKFASFRHRREKVQREEPKRDTVIIERAERRNSFSAASDDESHFLKTLQRWKQREDRKSASIGNVAIPFGGDQEANRAGCFLSDGNLRQCEDEVDTPRRPMALMDELKRALAIRRPSKVQEVELRRQSSQPLRTDSSRSKTCFLYPGATTGGIKVHRHSGGTPTTRVALAKQGPLDRIKVTTNGGARRLPRNWSRRRYACLAVDGRFCAAEDPTFAVEAATRRSQTPDPSVLILEVRGSNITRGSTHSSKKNVVEVSKEGSLALLQSDDATIGEAWYEALTRVAGNTTTPNKQDQTARSALGRFFSGGRRPTRESLEHRGIYRDEPVFGSRLELLCEDAKPPQFVLECTSMLEIEPHVLQQGLYRTSGNLSHIQRLRLRVDQGDSRAVIDEQDTDVLAGSLKLFFRELREPLIPYTAFVRLLEEALPGHEAHVRRSLHRLLPPAHLATLAELCRHLATVCKQERHNQMSPTSMAIVWGPSLTWPEDGAPDAILQCTRVNRLVEYLIANEAELFR